MLLSILKKKAIVSLNEISMFRLINCSSEKLLKSGFDQLRFAVCNAFVPSTCDNIFFIDIHLPTDLVRSSRT